MLSTGTGLSPTMADISISFPFLQRGHWPGPRSLATTNGVSVDVLSSGYLDVSVPQVSSLSGDLNGRVSPFGNHRRSEEHTSELQSRPHLVCRLLLEKKKKKKQTQNIR